MEYQVDRIEMERQDTAVVRGTVAMDQVPQWLGGAFGEVMAALAAQGIEPAGPPFGCYLPGEAGLVVEAGVPVTRPVQPTGRVERGETPGGWTLLVLHRGPYDEVPAAYAAAEEWMAGNDWEASGPPWEAYLDGPEVAQPRTVVHVPCRPR